jgi:hypothetical protein
MPVRRLFEVFWVTLVADFYMGKPIEPIAASL